jgi:hypothetical protein
MLEKYRKDPRFTRFFNHAGIPKNPVDFDKSREEIMIAEMLNHMLKEEKKTKINMAIHIPIGNPISYDGKEIPIEKPLFIYPPAGNHLKGILNDICKGCGSIYTGTKKCICNNSQTTTETDHGSYKVPPVVTNPLKAWDKDRFKHKKGYVKKYDQIMEQEQI